MKFTPEFTGDRLEDEMMMHAYWHRVSCVLAGVVGFLGTPYIVLIIALLTK